MLEQLKKGWEKVWLPVGEEDEEIEITKKRAQIELRKDKKYESRWVWYHTLLAVELAVIILILLGVWWKI